MICRFDCICDTGTINRETCTRCNNRECFVCAIEMTGGSEFLVGWECGDNVPDAIAEII